MANNGKSISGRIVLQVRKINNATIRSCQKSFDGGRNVMSRRRTNRKSNVSLPDLIMFVLMLFAWWWIRNIGSLTSLLVFAGVAAAGYLGFRLLLAWKAKQRLAASGIHQVDRMSGVEFEKFTRALFEHEGYKVQETPKTSDYGGDLVLRKNGRNVVVQAKRWDGIVGIKSVQEVLGAMNYYDAQKGIVLTNSDFTENAYNLAKKSPVELWNREKLIDELMESGAKPAEESGSDRSGAENDRRTCPRCGSTLVVRSGRRGRFWGCTDYPDCRYTSDL